MSALSYMIGCRVCHVDLCVSVLQLEGSDRSGSSQSLRHLQTSTTSNRPQSENQTNNQSPNKVTRSQSATSSGTRGQRRHSHGGDNNAHGSMKRKPDSLAFCSYKPFQCISCLHSVFRQEIKLKMLQTSFPILYLK